MTNHPPDQTQYWDANLDPANLNAHVGDATAALAREIAFAEHTPDVTQMLNYIVTNATAPNPHCPPLVADIGAGLGAISALLQRRGLSVIALDISHNRLATLRQAIPELSPGTTHPPIYAVKCRAEALPFRNATIQGACTRAVLIHTNIPAACSEINRALSPSSPVAFAEVMAHNPFANLYRKTLAPKQWRTITTYFTHKEIVTVINAIDTPTARPFYVLAFLAFSFQFAIPTLTLFKPMLKLLTATDQLLGKIAPRYWRYAWFTLITGKTRQP